jgi:hypothetical protein
MNAIEQGVGHDAAPEQPAQRVRGSFFALFGGPLAWFLQLIAGFAFASNPCFSNGERDVVPHLSADSTSAAMIALMIIACAVALLATLISWRRYSRTAEQNTDLPPVVELGSRRTRFLSLWGIFLGGGSVIVTALTAVAFFVLPRCAG